MLAEVDRATGVLLMLRSRAQGAVFRELSATSVKTAEQIDRSRFQVDIPPSAETERRGAGSAA